MQSVYGFNCCLISSEDNFSNIHDEGQVYKQYMNIFHQDGIEMGL